MLSLLAAVACSDSGKPVQLQEVRVAKSGFLSNAPMLIGDREGYFAREGIRLKFVDLPTNSVQGLPALSRGDVDVVSAAVSVGFFNAVLSGSDLRIVADRGHFDPAVGCESFGIVGRKSLFGDRPIDAKALRGRRFAMNAVGQTGYLAALFLKRYGLKVTDVEAVRLPATTERHALDAGTVDVVARSDPFFYQVMQGGHRLLAGGSSLAPGSHLAVLVFGPSLLRRNRELGERFMVAYLRAVRQYNKGRTDRNLEIISRGLGLDTADLRKMCWLPTDSSGAVNLESLTHYQEWGLETGNLARIQDPSAVTDTTFAANAARSLNAETKRQ
jgi:NitT/TauT family transport system substrate-binding protein